ncbi:hypothetical protein QBC41DRAFT_42409 [Cercophora samala]|uniref:Uncharacterized protein n=1 Tax=Cercophora samala TaxID=330535 RepID=A0AA39ZIX3_9PEZI|nr:hypothetical protein QBC41DRAFT_42409 [Cercophora samala]
MSPANSNSRDGILPPHQPLPNENFLFVRRILTAKIDADITRAAVSGRALCDDLLRLKRAHDKARHEYKKAKRRYHSKQRDYLANIDMCYNSIGKEVAQVAITGIKGLESLQLSWDEIERRISHQLLSLPANEEIEPPVLGDTSDEPGTDEDDSEEDDSDANIGHDENVNQEKQKASDMDNLHALHLQIINERHSRQQDPSVLEPDVLDFEDDSPSRQLLSDYRINAETLDSRDLQPRIEDPRLRRRRARAPRQSTTGAILEQEAVQKLFEARYSKEKVMRSVLGGKRNLAWSILQLPYVRPAKLRGRTFYPGGVENPDDKRTYNWDRTSNVIAAIAQTRGQVAPRPCTRCIQGYGPFTECVITDSLRGGVCCANCNFNDKATWCSFRRVGRDIE